MLAAAKRKVDGSKGRTAEEMRRPKGGKGGASTKKINGFICDMRGVPIDQNGYPFGRVAGEGQCTPSVKKAGWPAPARKIYER
jgi:hypothetical protein